MPKNVEEMSLRELEQALSDALDKVQDIQDEITLRNIAEPAFETHEEAMEFEHFKFHNEDCTCKFSNA